MALTQISTQGIKDGTITGSDLATNIELVDNQKIRFGTGNDLEIFHDGNHSRINDAGTGALIVSASKFQINNAAGNEVQAFFLQNGTSALYYDNSKKFETSSTGATVTGTLIADGLTVGDAERIKLGNDGDLELYHDGSNTKIDNATGELQIFADTFRVISKSTDENIIKGLNNGAVELYHNNSKKFHTTTNGAQITGHLFMDDDNIIKLGNSQDLQIYHDSSSSRNKIECHNGELRIDKGSGTETMAIFKPDAEVQLLHDDSKKFETTSTGVNITSANDAVLKITTTGTASTDDARLEIITQESSFIIQNDRSLSTDGALTIGDGSKTYFQANKDTGVELYYNNVKHFETNSGGVKVNDSKYMAFGNHNDLQISHDGSNSLINVTGTGTLRIQEDGSNQWEFNGANFKGNDDRKIILGDSSDLQLFHDGNDSFIKDVGVGGLVLCAHQFLVRNAAANEIQIQAVENGAVELYHDNSLKFFTSAVGINSATHLPDTDNAHDLGASYARWDDVFATNGTIQTSDKNEKENINESDLGLDFINKLSPKSFNFKNKTRTHYGLIAQDIETVITDLGKTTTQFAPLIKNKLEDETERYGLRYTELIAPLIKAIQELSTEVAALKAS